NGLSRSFKYCRVLGLLTCTILLTSVLDNVPDCPELFNHPNTASSSLQCGGHLDAATIVPSPSGSFLPAPQFSIYSQLVTYESALNATGCVRRSLPLAADPSPPLI